MRLLLGSERRPPICEAHSVAMEANVIGHVGAEIKKRGDFGPKPTGRHPEPCGQGLCQCDEAAEGAAAIAGWFSPHHVVVGSRRPAQGRQRCAWPCPICLITPSISLWPRPR